MTGRIYTVPMGPISVAAVQDLIAVYAGASMAFKVHAINIGQKTATSVGNLSISFKILPSVVTAGSGGSAATVQKNPTTNAAATVTARINDTTQATTAGTAILMPDVYNPINGYIYQWAPEDRPVIGLSQAFVVSLDTAPSAQVTSATLTIEEII